ncbi:MAG TPA: hypothetical protein PLZ55_06440 [bacterium]|nr:hypothetical protein [bacterium]
MHRYPFNRRCFLQTTSLVAGAFFSQGCVGKLSKPTRRRSEMIPRPDLLPDNADPQLQVFQLTTESIPCAHVYMEAQIFTPDSKRFIYRRSAAAHDGYRHNPDYRLMLCDLENGGEMSALVHEPGAAGPSISPDGQFLYYFVGKPKRKGERISLKRVRLDGSERETLHVIDGPLPGTNYYLSNLYPLSTISSDGKRISISCFLGDGQTENAPFGLLVYDIEKADVRMILEGPSWYNIHPQYCRSLEPDASHDLLVQENHGVVYNAAGEHLPGKLVGGNGADIHVIRDDGMDFRTLPCGRDPELETCQGHQCWRGRETTAVIGTEGIKPEGKERRMELIEGCPVPDWGHLGIHTLDTWRNDLSRSFPDPRFCHFGTDIAGKRIMSDARTQGHWLLYTAEWGPGRWDALQNWRFLLDARASGDAHPHPFLSPDGRTGFFNSDESGILRPYMITGLWSEPTHPV